MLRKFLETRRAAKAKAAKDALKVRAVMPTQASSRIYISIDKKSRIGVGQAWGDDHGDCVGLRWNPEGTTHWLVQDLSPARARLLAADLLAHCDRLEAENGTAPIDTPDTDFEAKLIAEEAA